MTIISPITVVLFLCFAYRAESAALSRQADNTPLLSRHRGPHCPAPIEIHLPPTFNSSHPPTWTPSPPGWFYGNWKVTYSSIPTYLQLLNMEFDSAPLPNATIPGQNSDLTSYQLASSNDSSRIWTAYGIDTPRPRNFNVYDFQGTGKLNAISNTWELLAWGEDSRGDGYLVIYETPVVATGGPAGLDIESRVEGGPSLETLGHIFKALTGLGNEELTKLVGEIGKVPRNGARENLAPVICDEDCRENVNQPS